MINFCALIFSLSFTLHIYQISGADDLFKKPLAPPKKDEKSKV